MIRLSFFCFMLYLRFSVPINGSAVDAVGPSFCPESGRFPAVSSPTTSDRRSDWPPRREATAHLSLPIEVESSLAPCFLLSPAKPHSLSFTGGPVGRRDLHRRAAFHSQQRFAEKEDCKGAKPLDRYILTALRWDPPVPLGPPE